MSWFISVLSPSSGLGQCRALKGGVREPAERAPRRASSLGPARLVKARSFVNGNQSPVVAGLEPCAASFVVSSRRVRTRLPPPERLCRRGAKHFAGPRARRLLLQASAAKPQAPLSGLEKNRSFPSTFALYRAPPGGGTRG